STYCRLSWPCGECFSRSREDLMIKVRAIDLLLSRQHLDTQLQIMQSSKNELCVIGTTIMPHPSISAYDEKFVQIANRKCFKARKTDDQSMMSSYQIGTRFFLHHEPS